MALGIALAGLAGLAGCTATPSAPPCVVDADCASGVCLGTGRCAPQQDAGPSPIDGSVATPDASFPDAGGSDAGSDRCRPNGDGVVTRLEAPFGPGLMARYATALDVAVSTAGSDLGGGRRGWDLSAAMPGDRDLDLVTEALDGRWYADKYPGADYVTRLAATSDLLGVFRVNGTSLELMGVVSPTDGVTRTELTYTPPVKVLVFPLELGSRWSTSARVTGLAEGLAVNIGETYDSEVDAHGELRTPYAPFEALRVRTTLVRDVGFVRTTVRQMVFVAECFGTVATIVSQDDETQVEFDQASELRRLSF